MTTRASTLKTISSLLCLALALGLADAASAQGGAGGRRYAPGAFDGIAISGTASVKLVQGNDDSVFVEGGEDAQNAVSLDVDDGVLRVRPGGAWKFWRSKELQMTITSRDLKQLQISGAADVVARRPAAPAPAAREDLRRRLGAPRQAEGRAPRLHRLRAGHGRR